MINAFNDSRWVHNVGTLFGQINMPILLVTNNSSSSLGIFATTRRARRGEYVLVARLMVSRARETSLRFTKTKKEP